MRTLGLGFRNRKGQMAFYVILLAIVLVFVFALINVFTYKVFDEINTDMQSDDGLDNLTKETVDDIHDRFPETMDNALLVILVGFFLMGIVVGYFGSEHPALIILFFVISVFLLIVAMNVSNTWDEVMSDSDLSSLQGDFPITDFVLDNYLLVIGGGIFSCLLAMFIRVRYGG